MTSSDSKPEQPEAAVDDLDERAVKQVGLSKKQQELMHSRLLANNFGNMVTVMMQSPHHQRVPLSELHSRLVPALAANQFRIAEVAKEGSGVTIPVGLIIWACVSNELHEKMKQQLDRPIMLKGDEWTSGDNLWIIDVVGAERFLAPLLTRLRKSEFKDRVAHYRTRTEDGVKIQTLQDGEAASTKDRETPPTTVADPSSNGPTAPVQ